MEFQRLVGNAEGSLYDILAKEGMGLWRQGWEWGQWCMSLWVSVNIRDNLNVI